MTILRNNFFNNKIPVNSLYSLKVFDVLYLQTEKTLLFEILLKIFYFLDLTYNELIQKCINSIEYYRGIFHDNINEDEICYNNLYNSKINIDDYTGYVSNAKISNEIVKDYTAMQKNQQISLLQEDWMNESNLENLESVIKNCSKCNLCGTRTNFVFGTGNPDADVVLIGEAPGAEEDKQGKPFVGRAGQLLTDILKAINFTREEVYICNILKCRPPDNRNPLPEEIFKCEPYLLKQIELIKPKFILALGTFAAQTLLKNRESLGKMRGKFFDFYAGSMKAKLLVTYHPAALLRNPHWKRPTWEDVKLFRKEYDLNINQ